MMGLAKMAMGWDSGGCEDGGGDDASRRKEDERWQVKVERRGK